MQRSRGKLGCKPTFKRIHDATCISYFLHLQILLLSIIYFRLLPMALLVVLFLLSATSSLTQPVDCPYGHFYFDDSCVECLSSCSECRQLNFNNKKCDGCSEGFTLSLDEYQCEDCGQGVEKCEPNTTMTCFYGYSYESDKNQCLQTCMLDDCSECEQKMDEEGCKVCENKITGQKCNLNGEQQQNDNGSSQKKNGQNGQTENTNESQNSNKQEQKLLPQQNEEQLEEVSDFNPSRKEEQIILNRRLLQESTCIADSSSGFCTECHQKCLNCLNTKDQCIECSEGYIKIGWKCISQKNMNFEMTLNTTEETFKDKIKVFREFFIKVLPQGINAVNTSFLTLTNAEINDKLYVNVTGIIDFTSDQDELTFGKKLTKNLQKQLYKSNKTIAGMPVVGTLFYKGTGLLLDDDEEADDWRGLTDSQLAIAIIVPIVLLILIVAGCIYCNSRKEKEETEIKQTDTERMMKS